ncbi:MAG: hypothetical protein IJ422_03900 [Oscillospiraceae bacterium]|nr:hypothetical protein [Oscillospiraceae bacterium]
MLLQQTANRRRDKQVFPPVICINENDAKAVQSSGVAACAKHYPGDGVDYRDHHLHPTYNSLPADKWYDSYSKVHENLIANGLMSVMVCHIGQPELCALHFGSGNFLQDDFRLHRTFPSEGKVQARQVYGC